MWGGISPSSVSIGLRVFGLDDCIHQSRMVRCVLVQNGQPSGYTQSLVGIHPFEALQSRPTVSPSAQTLCRPKIC